MNILRTLNDSNISYVAKKIYLYFTEHSGTVSKQDLEEKFSLKENQLNNFIGELAKNGLIRFVGNRTEIEVELI